MPRPSLRTSRSALFSTLAGLSLVASLSALTLHSARARADEAPPAFPFEEATAAQLEELQQKGLLTSRALTEAYLARIKLLDPQLQSVLEVNPDALAIADALDAERKSKGPRGPLHGLPILVKDNVATGDKQLTTAGSLALQGVHAKKDAAIIERLRAAGAVILGKTNLSEWANIRSSHSSSGWSGRGGQTHNPYALDRTPCGSSSGTGSAIAANLAVFGVGTETDGSIVCPSTSQSLVGIKPTVGLVSRAGIVPISHTQDTAGPMARTVADAALLLTALAGPDKADPATAAAPKPVDYTKVYDPAGGRLDGVRIGVARAKIFGSSPAADAVTEAAILKLRTLGAELVDPADIPHLGEYGECEDTVLLTELKADLPLWLKEYAPQAPIKNLEEAIAWNRAHAAQELQFFAQETFEKAQAKGPLSGEEYQKALGTCRKLAREQGLEAVFAEKKLDALLAPTGGAPWVIDLVTGDSGNGVSSSGPAAVSGTPAITVPAGFDHGLPLGVTFMGLAWSEAKLIKIAHAFEQATKARRPPKLLRSADLVAPGAAK